MFMGSIDQCAFTCSRPTLERTLQTQRFALITHHERESQLQWPFSPQRLGAAGTTCAVLTESARNVRSDAGVQRTTSGFYDIEPPTHIIG